MAFTQVAADKRSISLYATKDATLSTYYGFDIGSVRLYFGTGSPNGVITAPAGSLYISLTAGVLYNNTTSGTTWTILGSAGAGGTATVAQTTAGCKTGITCIASKDATDKTYYGFDFGPIRIYFGDGTPNALITAPIGSLFIRNTAAGGKLYANTDAGTTWACVGDQS